MSNNSDKMREGGVKEHLQYIGEYNKQSLWILEKAAKPKYILIYLSNVV